MELPILLACDTTANWEKSDTVLGESELALDIAGKKNDGELIKYLMVGDGMPVGPNAKRLRATPEIIAGLPETLRGLADAVTHEAEKRDAAIEVAFKEFDDAKIGKDIAGKDGTFIQSLEVKEITANRFVAVYKKVNVENGFVTEVEVELPQANQKKSGIMPAEKFAEIDNHGERIETLESLALKYPVNLNSPLPSQDELYAAYEAVSQKTGTPPDLVTLDDMAYNKSYTYYKTIGEWVDKGHTTLSHFSNTKYGSILGDYEDGNIFAKPNGIGRVAGWDVYKAKLATAVQKDEVINNLISMAVNIPLSANQGRLLSEAICDLPVMIFNQDHPIGSLFETVDPTKLPGANIPGVVWTEYGRGQTIVGVDDSAEFSPDTTKPFNMREGGAKTVQLTANQSGLRQHGHGDGNHNHLQDSHYHNFGSDISTGTYESARRGISHFYGMQTDSRQPHIHHCGGIIGNQGPWDASEAHNNLQPYKTAYRYVRTA